MTEEPFVRDIRQAVREGRLSRRFSAGDVGRVLPRWADTYRTLLQRHHVGNPRGYPAIVPCELMDVRIEPEILAAALVDRGLEIVDDPAPRHGAEVLERVSAPAASCVAEPTVDHNIPSEQTISSRFSRSRRRGRTATASSEE